MKSKNKQQPQSLQNKRGAVVFVKVSVWGAQKLHRRKLFILLFDLNIEIISVVSYTE